MLKLFFCILMLTSSNLKSLEYGLFSTHKSTKQITKGCIFSERCSGSNYIRSLVRHNFQKLSWDNFCHKHFPPWYELPQSKYFGNSKSYTFSETDEYLIIIVFRNPYDWVRSFHNQPHHAASELLNLSFTQFIRTPWRTDTKDKWIPKEEITYNPLIDRNPLDGSQFKNVLHLRTAKIRNMLMIAERAPNVYVIDYETVNDHPKEVLKEIASIYNLTPTDVYNPIGLYKGGGNTKVTYTPKIYNTLSLEDLQYINSNLDKELENKIGYTLVDDPAKLNKRVSPEQ